MVIEIQLMQSQRNGLDCTWFWLKMGCGGPQNGLWLIIKVA